MKTYLRFAVACAVVSSLPVAYALAAQDGAKTITVVPETSPAQESQQHRMKRCNVEAKEKELRGDERRAFMSRCLKR